MYVYVLCFMTAPSLRRYSAERVGRRFLSLLQCYCVYIHQCLRRTHYVHWVCHYNLHKKKYDVR